MQDINTFVSIFSPNGVENYPHNSRATRELVKRLNKDQLTGEKCKELLQKGANLHYIMLQPEEGYVSYIPLVVMASFQGNFEVVKVLIEAGADPQARLFATNKSRTRTVDVWEQGFSALPFAFFADNLQARQDLIELLISKGLDVNEVLPNKKTVFGVALTGFAPELVALIKLLLQKGANPNYIWEEWGKQRTLLGALAFTGSSVCVQLLDLLIEAGANKLLFDTDTETYEYNAFIAMNLTDACIFLVERGLANPLDLVGSMHNNYLHQAVIQDNLELVEFFIQKGVLPTHKNDNGKSPIDFAREKESRPLLHLLEGVELSEAEQAWFVFIRANSSMHLNFNYLRETSLGNMSADIVLEIADYEDKTLLLYRVPTHDLESDYSLERVAEEVQILTRLLAVFGHQDLEILGMVEADGLALMEEKLKTWGVKNIPFCYLPSEDGHFPIIGRTMRFVDKTGLGVCSYTLPMLEDERNQMEPICTQILEHLLNL